MERGLEKVGGVGGGGVGGDQRNLQFWRLLFSTTHPYPLHISHDPLVHQCAVQQYMAIKLLVKAL